MSDEVFEQPEAENPDTTGLNPDILTDKQRLIWEFFLKFQVENGLPPTIRLAAKHFGIKSPNGMVSHLKLLVKKGFLARRIAAGEKANLCWTAVPLEKISVQREGEMVRVQLHSHNLTRVEAEELISKLKMATRD